MDSPCDSNVNVTCVIPSLNQGEFIEKAILSLQNQDLPVQLVLMDGGSNDDTLKVVSRYRKHLHYLVSQPDRGQAAAINQGVTLGDGRYVCWLNADDILLPGALQQQIRFLEEHPKSPAVHGIGVNIDAADRRLGLYPSRPATRSNLVRGCPVCQPTTLIRRTAWEKTGGLDESFQVCLDYDLWWRLEPLGEIGFIPRELACNRVHSNTKTTRLRHQHYREAYRILRREMGRVPAKWLLDGWFETSTGSYPRQASARQWLTALYQAPSFFQTVYRSNSSSKSNR